MHVSLCVEDLSYNLQVSHQTKLEWKIPGYSKHFSHVGPGPIISFLSFNSSHLIKTDAPFYINNPSNPSFPAEAGGRVSPGRGRGGDVALLPWPGGLQRGRDLCGGQGWRPDVVSSCEMLPGRDVFQPRV